MPDADYLIIGSNFCQAGHSKLYSYLANPALLASYCLCAQRNHRMITSNQFDNVKRLTDGIGLVVAGADDGVAVLGRRDLGDGALYARDPSGEPHEPQTWKEAGRTETTASDGRKDRMKYQICHISRTDPCSDWPGGCGRARRCRCAGSERPWGWGTIRA